MRSPSELLGWIRTPMGRKAFRYSVVSAVSIVITQAVFFFTYGIFRVGSPQECNIIAAVAATAPSYYLNRNWAWGRGGSSHLWKEVVPFWVVAILGLLFSLLAVGLAQDVVSGPSFTHLEATLILNFTVLTSYGILWVGKFLLFNHLLFAESAAEDEPVSIGSAE